MSEKKIYWIVADVNTRNAGYRVRTLPLASALTKYGMHVEILSMKELHTDIEKIAHTAEVVIVAKPGDTDSYLCMRYLKECGVAVIVDLFDNYFSWSPALYKRGVTWQWLRAVEISSAICSSTLAIAETVRSLGFENIHVISDSAPKDFQEIVPGVNLHTKWDNPEVIELLWFGISDNPYFYAGIDDLISWSNVVCALRDSIHVRYAVRLTICTNRVAAVQDAILYFSHEGIDVRFEEWTEERCSQLMVESHVVLIPTNLSSFSRSKTHNRCSDAIWRQCLVLAGANGPYIDIPGGVHTSVKTLAPILLELHEVEIASQMNTSATYISSNYRVENQSRELSQIIEKIRPEYIRSIPDAGLPAVLIAGAAMSISTLKLSRKLNYLSAGISGSAVNGNFDFLLISANAENEILTFQLSSKATALFVEGSTVFSLDDLGTRDWTVTQDGGEKYLTIHMPELRTKLQRLSVLQSVRHVHGDLFEQWFELAIELSIRALNRLRFESIEFGANDGGGWQSWLALSGQHLQGYVERLRSDWSTRAGMTDADRPLKLTTAI